MLRRSSAAQTQEMRNVGGFGRAPLGPRGHRPAATTENEGSRRDNFVATRKRKLLRFSTTIIDADSGYLLLTILGERASC